jgi:hypothetical protein
MENYSGHIEKTKKVVDVKFDTVDGELRYRPEYEDGSFGSWFETGKSGAMSPKALKDEHDRILAELTD